MYQGASCVEQFRNRIFVRLLILIPQLSLGQIADIKFPVPLLIIQPSLQPLFLLFLRNMQEEFQMVVPSSASIFSNSLMRS